MKTYQSVQEEIEYGLWCESLDLLQSNQLNEFSFSIPSSLKRYYDFAKEIVEKIGMNIKDMITILKDSRVFKFFKMIKFSFSKLFDFIKKGYKAYVDLHKALGQFMANTKVAKWTTEKIAELDQFLQNHPKTKRMAGFAVGALLVYIWTQLISFVGDIDFDFSQESLFNALLGKFTLTDIFGGESGVKLLTFVITGNFTSFPWPGSTSVLFIGSIIYTLVKLYQIRGVTVPNPNTLPKS